MLKEFAYIKAKSQGNFRRQPVKSERFTGKFNVQNSQTE